MRTLGSLGPRSFRRNTGRFVLTGVGITLGVAVQFGILLTNVSITHSVDRQLAPSQSSTVHVTSASIGDSNIPADLVSRAARISGVARAYGTLGFASPMLSPGTRDLVYVYATVNATGSARQAPVPLGQQNSATLQGRLPAGGRDEVVVGGVGLAQALNAHIGAPLTLTTPLGPRRFLVTGEYVFARSDTRAGLLTTMDAVRRATNDGPDLNDMTISLGAGVDQTQWILTHGDDLGAGVRLTNDNQGAADLRNLFATVRGSFAALAAVAMFVGGFLVFLTLSMAVIERTRLYGTLRALGASRGQVLRVVVGEALALGTVSTLAGLAIGLAAGAGFLSFTARVYGVSRPRFEVPVWTVLAAAGIGLAVTVAAAVIPALRASRLSPVEAIRGSYAEDRRLGRAWIFGAALFAIGLVCARTTSTLLLQAASPMILAGTVLMVPLITRPIASLVGRATRRLAPGLGDIGVMHLVKERSRSAYTLGLVMVVLALALAVGGVHRSFRATQAQSLARSYPADLAVFSAQIISGPFEDRVRSTSGVRAISEIRFGDTAVQGRGGARVLLTVIDPATFFAVQPVPWTAGSDAAAAQALTRGDAVLVPGGLAQRFGVRLGGRLTLATNRGPHQFRVAGIYPTNDSQKRLTVGLPDAKRFFNAGGANLLAVRVDPGADPTHVAAAIQASVRDHGGAFVQPTAPQKAHVRKVLDDYFNLLYSVLFIAAAMGVLGLGNTLAMSVVRRTREIGVLRAVGTDRGQVRGLVLVEAATLTLVALGLAIPLGWLLSATILRSSDVTLGIVVGYRQPWALVPLVGVLALGAGAVAAIAPARRAARIQPVAALRFE